MSYPRAISLIDAEIARINRAATAIEKHTATCTDFCAGGLYWCAERHELHAAFRALTLHFQDFTNDLSASLSAIDGDRLQWVLNGAKT